MSRGKLTLPKAFCFGIVCLYLAVISSSAGSHKRKHLLDDHNVGHQLVSRRNHSHRLNSDDKPKIQIWYQIAYMTPGQSRDSFKLAEIAAFFTENDCLKLGLRCGPNTLCGATKTEHKLVCFCERKRCSEEPEEFVCSDDGRTFRNPCELGFRSCMFGLNTTSYVKGKCPITPRYDRDIVTYGCGQQDSSVNSQKARSNKIPTAGCYQYPFGPVCGSDGRVYENLCALDQVNCIEKNNIRPVNSRLCLKPNARIKPPRVNQREGVTSVDAPMSKCALKGLICRSYSTCGQYSIKEGSFWPTIREEYECICDTYCNSTYGDINAREYICGTDLKTYNSPCELKRTACYGNLYLEEDFHYSNCLKPQVFYEPNKKSQAPPKLKHLTTTTTISCEQLDSVMALLKEENTVESVCNTDPSRPVCGSDRRVYEDLCSLDQFNCNNEESVTHVDTKMCLQPNVTIKEPRLDTLEGFEGIEVPAHTCQKSRIECPPYASCARFDIPKAIESEWPDSLYPSDRTIVRYGCKCNTTCPTVKDPVCGSDGKIHFSPCELRRKSCYENHLIKEVDPSNCLKRGIQFNPKNEVQSTPRPTPNIDATSQSCSRVKVALQKLKLNEVSQGTCYQNSPRPVCGSNGVVYENLCALDQENCRMKTSVTPVEQKLCLKPNAPPGGPKILDMNGTAVVLNSLSSCHVVCRQYTTCEISSMPKLDENSITERGKENTFGCRCKLNCNLNAKEPVCGSDGLIYPSMCELKKTYCNSGYFRSLRDEPEKPSHCLKIGVHFDPNLIVF